MASFSQLYNNHAFSDEYIFDFQNPLNQLEAHDLVAVSDAATMSNCSTIVDDRCGASNASFQSDYQYQAPMCSESAETSSALTAFFPERFGISELAIETAMLPVFKHNNGIDVFGGFHQCHNSGQSLKFGEECCGYPPNFIPAMNPVTAAENYPGTQGGNQVPATAETNAKVGKYSVEERKDRILRYLKKRNQRNFNKTIKYACRKNLADRRVRVRGRFAKNNELSEQDQTAPSQKNNNPKKEEDLYSGDDFAQMRIENDDGWLEEAVSNLMYFPYDPYVDDQKTWSL